MMAMAGQRSFGQPVVIVFEGFCIDCPETIKDSIDRGFAAVIP